MIPASSVRYHDSITNSIPKRREVAGCDERKIFKLMLSLALPFRLLALCFIKCQSPRSTRKNAVYCTPIELLSVWTALPEEATNIKEGKDGVVFLCSTKLIFGCARELDAVDNSS